MRSDRIHWARKPILILVMATVPLVLPADDYYVNTTADTNDGICSPFIPPCSLRDAILTANANPGGDTIHLPTGTYTLTITGTGEDDSETGDLDILESVTILGSGADDTIVDANQIDRVFDILGSSTVSFHDLTIRDGASTSGAGVWVRSSGGLTIARCIVESNVALSLGGGIWVSEGNLSISDSRIRGNEGLFGSGVCGNPASELTIERSTLYANDRRPGSSGGGAVAVYGTGEITNSTFSNNNDFGLVVAGGASVPVDSCTFAGNLAGIGVPSTDPGFVSLHNTIISGSCAGPAAALITMGGNVEGPGDTCDLTSPPTDYHSVPIYLRPLNYYGGPTPTMPLEFRPGNVALDNPATTTDCLAEDQRGDGRPDDGDGDGFAVCDSGAVEAALCASIHLQDDTITGTETHEACIILADTNLAVSGGGDLTLSADQYVQIGDGFEVLTDGVLTVKHWDSQP